MHYLATIKVLVKADSQAEACDLLSETLRPAVVDWTYLDKDTPPSRLHADHSYDLPIVVNTGPVGVSIPDNYSEGDLREMS